MKDKVIELGPAPKWANYVIQHMHSCVPRYAKTKIDGYWIDENGNKYCDGFWVAIERIHHWEH